MIKIEIEQRIMFIFVLADEEELRENMRRYAIRNCDVNENEFDLIYNLQNGLFHLIGRVIELYVYSNFGLTPILTYSNLI